MRRSTFRTKAVALGILIVAAVVGNVSLSASRVRPDGPVSTQTVFGSNEVSCARGAPTADGHVTRLETAAEGMDRVAAPAKDESHIVPAIYSWDPDVTFVFYRHVTKWM